MQIWHDFEILHQVSISVYKLVRYIYCHLVAAEDSEEKKYNNDYSVNQREPNQKDRELQEQCKLKVSMILIGFSWLGVLLSTIVLTNEQVNTAEVDNCLTKRWNEDNFIILFKHYTIIK